MKLSVSSYSFQQYIRAGKMTQLDVVKKAAEMGFEGIDFIDLAPSEKPTKEEQLTYAEKIRREAERYGITIVAYTIGANLYTGSPKTDAAEVKRLCDQLDVAAALGAKIMRHDVCRTEVFDGRVIGYDRMLPTIAKNARKVTAYAKKLGIRTCSENHGFIAQDSDRVERLYNAVDDDNYGLLVDIGNFACVDEDSAKAVSRLAPYAIHVHAKDFLVIPNGEKPTTSGYITTRGCNYLFGCPIGEGQIPVKRCIDILKRAKYDGFLTIEYEGAEDCIVGISRGMQNLKQSIG